MLYAIHIVSIGNQLINFLYVLECVITELRTGLTAEFAHGIDRDNIISYALHEYMCVSLKYIRE